jgi:putative restriction endonuclease
LSGVTDNGWYRLLADRPDLLGEVNFWRPGGGGFRALRPGEPFFFKTHAPHNRVVGGGFFGGAARLPASEAWDLLGLANGAVSLEQMVDRIVHPRREPLAPGEDPVIGCIFIRDVTFFPDDLTFDPPPGFSSNVVQGKTYDMGDERYNRYFGDLMQMVLGVAAGLDLTQPWHGSGPVFGDPRLAPNRLGQQGFKAVVADAYHWRCAITGARIRPVLEAAHIRPVSPQYGGENRLDNGLLLRSDVHRMFDLGYLSVDTRYRLRVSSRLRTEFGNGEAFYAKEGTVITLPGRRSDQPNPDFLQWHMDTKFKASLAAPWPSARRGLEGCGPRRDWSGRRGCYCLAFLSLAFFPLAFFPLAFFPLAFFPLAFFLSALVLSALVLSALVPSALILSALVSPVLFPALTRALNPVPGRNFGTEDAGTWMAAPVAGLRPARAARWLFSKTPNPVIATLSPFATVDWMVSSTAFTASVADLLSPSRSEIASISSPLFMFTPAFPRGRVPLGGIATSDLPEGRRSSAVTQQPRPHSPSSVPRSRTRGPTVNT